MWLFMAVACFFLQPTDSQVSLNQTHLNPQEFMTISQIIQYWRYPHEEHQVLTADGYYLQVNRIPYGVNSSAKTGPRTVVLLVHGLFAEGRHWIANIPSNSLGFFLADAGYDVWILNCRGTTWSRRHRNLSIDQKKFWDFSFHEMGIYDVPATIQFILQKTQQDGLFYIGHSQGAAIGLIVLSVKPELGKYIKLLMLLAPPVSLVGSRGLIQILTLIPDRILRLIFGNKELILLSNKQRAIFAKLCSHHAVIDELCLQTINVYRKENLNVSRADVYVGIHPDYTSVKTLIHWKQVAKSHVFKYFDYGIKNTAVYKRFTPPTYPIEKITAPVAVWGGAKDKLSTPRNIEQFLPRIKRLVFHMQVPDWGHQDFIWGLDAPKRLFPDVLTLMHKYK